MANVGGWAFSKDSSELSQQARDDFRALHERLGERFVVERVSPQYAHTERRGYIDLDGYDGPEITLRDVGLLCDSGNLCFGGNGDLRRDGTKLRFRFDVYTD